MRRLPAHPFHHHQPPPYPGPTSTTSITLGQRRRSRQILLPSRTTSVSAWGSSHMSSYTATLTGISPHMAFFAYSSQLFLTRSRASSLSRESHRYRFTRGASKTAWVRVRTLAHRSIPLPGRTAVLLGKFL
jgi:hypothetical protein